MQPSRDSVRHLADVCGLAWFRCRLDLLLNAASARRCRCCTAPKGAVARGSVTRHVPETPPDSCRLDADRWQNMGLDEFQALSRLAKGLVIDARAAFYQAGHMCRAR